MVCKNCGTIMEDSLGLKICPECGKELFPSAPVEDPVPEAAPVPAETTLTAPAAAPAPEAVQQQYTVPVQNRDVQGQSNQSLIINGKNYTPISMWGYFGYELLFSIPIVGFIILLVFAFGGTDRVNLKNFARSYFCLTIIYVVLIALIAAFVIGGGLMLGL